MEDSQTGGQGQVGIAIETQSYSVVPGGALTIPVSLHNRGEGDELLDLTVRGVPAAWVSLPSSSVRLAPGERKERSLTIQTPGPPWGRAARHSVAVRAQRHQGSERVAGLEFTLTIAAHEVPGPIGILIESTEFSVTPGETTFVPVVLLNRGLDADSLNLSVEGIPAEWAQTPSASFRLLPGEQREVRLTIHPPRSTSSLAGPQPFKILASSQFSPERTAEVACILTIAEFTGFSGELQPHRVDAGQPARVSIENRGNSQQTFTLTWASPGDRLSFQPAPSQEVSVPRGDVEVIEFRANPRRRSLFGGEETLPFTARVESAQDAVQDLTGAVVSRAMAPSWVVPGVLFIGTLVLLVACFVLGN